MTRVDQAVSEIRSMILQKKHNSDGYLPSEGELCEMLNTSKATIREAVRTLEVRGFLTRIHGKGIVVNENSLEVMNQTFGDMYDKGEFTLEDVLEVRWMIEPKMTELAAKRISDAEIKELEKIIIKMEEINVNSDEYLNYDFQFHQKLVYASKNQLAIALFMSLYFNVLKDVINVSNQKTSDLEKINHYHRNILTALQERNPLKAYESMRNHLVSTEENLKK